MNRFDRQLWQRFWAIAKPYWFSEEKWGARGLLGLLLLLSLVSTGFSVAFNFQSGEFTSALAAKDSARFLKSVLIFIGLLVGFIPLFSFYRYVHAKLSIYWRRWMTNLFLDKYFKDRAFYEISSYAEIDNPDQRISEDIKTFTQQCLYFLIAILDAILQLIAFSGVLWSISKSLVIFLIIYATFGTFITMGIFGRVLIKLNFNQLKREANFRFGLVRIRENAESIAFYRGEYQESNKVRQLFNEAFSNFNRLIRWHLSLNFFRYGFTYVRYILPGIIVAPRVFAGEVEIGVVSQAEGAFWVILTSVSLIVNNFESISNFAAGIDRLDTFAKSLKVQTAARPEVAPTIDTVEDSRLAIEHVTLQTPNYQRTLVRDLSVAVNPGEGLLIVGTSGSGKSSLLRAIAGLWNSGTGAIVRPKLEEMLFLPQRPYMILGSLRDQLLYPNKDKEISDEELYGVLEMVNLPDLGERFGGFDVELDWGDVLSVGEQQRLAFARVLLTKPRYAMLDEATSALDIENEGNLYRQLQATSTTVVSVGHRPTILKYHQQVLELTGNGNWQLRSAEDYSFSSGG